MLIWMAAPLALRHMSFFRVRQVEIVGIRYLGADQVLAALALSPHASVFDDTDVLVDRLRALDGVAEVAVTRRPPGSLKVVVRETEPVAFVANARGALTVVDAGSRPLPFELVSLDLPVVQTGQKSDSGVVAVLARIQAVDPALFQTIDAARVTEDEASDVVLDVGRHRLLLEPDASPEVIQSVVLVARDLAAKARPYAELDARYAGQIVVRRRGSRIV
jgi:cell division septal protein FtsQ